MSKFSNVMKMLILLRSRNRMKINELAKELEVDDRTVRIYKDELLRAGIHVESSAGRHGGYSLPRQYNYLLNLSLTPDENTALEMVSEQLKSSGFIYQAELNAAMDKIRTAAKHSRTDIHEMHEIFGSKSSPSGNQLIQEREDCHKIHASILKRHKIQITYYSLSADHEEERILQPYALYEYRGALYVTGLCELRNEIRDFKLSRIRKIVELQDEYLIPKEFSLKAYMKNCLGIFKDTPIKVKLKIMHPMSQIIREKIWADDQKITDLAGENAIIFEATLQGRVEIISWILSIGSQVKVLEPEEIRVAVQDEARKIIGII